MKIWTELFCPSNNCTVYQECEHVHHYSLISALDDWDSNVYQKHHYCLGYVTAGRMTILVAKCWWFIGDTVWIFTNLMKPTEIQFTASSVLYLASVLAWYASDSTLHCSLYVWTVESEYLQIYTMLVKVKQLAMVRRDLSTMVTGQMKWNECRKVLLDHKSK